MSAGVTSVRKYRATKYLLTLCLLYLAFGKSFAYLGYYPLFIGEVVLVSFVIRPWWFAGRQPGDGLSRAIIIVMLALGIAQGLYSWGFLGQSGVEITRNLAVIYYSIYAFIAARVFTRDRVPLSKLLDFVSSLVPMMLIVAAVSFVMFSYAVQILPVFPKTDVPLLSFKPGDQSILVGIAIFLVSIGRLSGSWLFLAVPMATLDVAQNRGAMLAFAVFIFASALMRRARMQFIFMLSATVLVLLAIGENGISIGNYRTISLSQLSANSRSILSSDAGNDVDSSLEGTVTWRLDWWRKIMEDAQSSAFVPIGLGWGVNLADAYGFQTSADPDSLTVLRNPHNVFMGILARGGWSVALVWAAFYGVFIFRMLLVVYRHPSQDVRLCGLLVVLCVTAGLINGLVDVHLESPQNAIPHWCIVGIGWYCMSIKARAGNSRGLTQDIEISKGQPALLAEPYRSR
jgi:hypothetical protein